MDQLTFNVVIVVAFLFSMPLISLVVIKVLRRRGGASTRTVAKGAGDVGAPEWVSQVTSVDPETPTEPADIFPLLANPDDFVAHDPQETGTGVFGHALRPATLPTAPPPTPSEPSETARHDERD